MFTLSHHATLIEGEWERVKPELSKYLESEGVNILGNPDYLELITDSFGIDDGRALQSLASRKSFGARQVFVLVFSAITREAQNSLLKLFEEPTANTNFFIVTPSSTIFLPTLLSRVQTVKPARKDKDTKGAVKFLKARPRERLEMIKGIVENKDKVEAKNLLDGIETAIQNRGKDEKRGLAEYAETLREIVKVKNYLQDRGSSVKQILEHVSLILPRV